MPDRMLNGDPSDTRFQFEIIKGLADSIRQLTGSIQDMQKTQVNMLERLAALEASKFAASIDDLEHKVAALLRDKDRREGARGAFAMIKDWSPFIAAIMATLAAAWLFGRSLNIVPAPPVAPVRVEATAHPDENRIEGVVGGKP